MTLPWIVRNPRGLQIAGFLSLSDAVDFVKAQCRDGMILEYEGREIPSHDFAAAHAAAFADVLEVKA